MQSRGVRRGDHMESYIVRIYLRASGCPGRMTGVVLSMETEAEQPFSSAEQLRSILGQVYAAQDSKRSSHLKHWAKGGYHDD